MARLSLKKELSNVTSYQEFLARKKMEVIPTGFDIPESALNQKLFPFQSAIVRWAIRRGRAGVFANIGLGKTFMQLEIADKVCQQTGGKFLLLTPIAVGQQTRKEAEKFGIKTGIKVCKSAEEVEAGITITNYEKLHKFDVSEFVGVGLDEASILKSLDGSTRNSLIAAFQKTPYRYCFTATPSPNDIMEIGSYCEFLGIMSRTEMLAMFFTHDGGETAKWRLKGHAEKTFFEWMATWCVMIRKPADLGFSNKGYDLPELRIHEHIVTSNLVESGRLFQTEALTLADQRAARRGTIESRIELLAGMVNQLQEPWIVWCNLNDESEGATAAIPDALEIAGKHKESEKEMRLLAFSEKESRVLVSKPSLAGFGLNWQHCCKVAFLGLSHSWEEFYQAIGRCHRFGQKNPVDVHVIVSDRDAAITDNIKRKQDEADRLAAGMVEAMSVASRREIGAATVEKTDYNPQFEMDMSLWQRNSECLTSR